MVSRRSNDRWASRPSRCCTRRAAKATFDFVAVDRLFAGAAACSGSSQRDGISEEEARRRIAAQMPAEEKAQRANFVILTGGTTLATDRQVDELLVAIFIKSASR